MYYFIFPGPNLTGLNLIVLNLENRSVFLSVVLEVREWKLELLYGSCMPAVW